MTTQQSSPFDIAPMWKMYMEPIELWKKNYETFLKNTPFRADGMDEKKGEVESITSPNDAALLKWQKSGEEIFKRLCKTRWSLPLLWPTLRAVSKFPERLSQCRSLTELGNFQSSFLSQFTNDYMQETEKLASRSPIWLGRLRRWFC